MADSHPARGHLRRPEGIKCLKLRESMYNLWIEQKEALGLHGITNKILWGYFCTKNLHESVIDLLTCIRMILHLAGYKIRPPLVKWQQWQQSWELASKKGGLANFVTNLNPTSSQLCQFSWDSEKDLRPRITLHFSSVGQCVAPLTRKPEDSGYKIVLTSFRYWQYVVEMGKMWKHKHKSRKHHTRVTTKKTRDPETAKRCTNSKSN